MTEIGTDFINFRYLSMSLVDKGIKYRTQICGRFSKQSDPYDILDNMSTGSIS